jgi:parvulin-like peptidyl-prolyl isomerase
MIDFSRASLDLSEIVNLLKEDFQLKQVWKRILYKKVIQKSAIERGLTITEKEIQEECERIRRDKRLEKASDTIAWLAEEMITVEDLEAGLRDRLLSRKLSEHLFGKEVEKYFVENRLTYDQVLLYQIVVTDAKLAQELYYQLQDQEISFYDASHLYDIDEKRRQMCGYEGKLYRWALKPEIAAVVFSSQPGEFLRPIEINQEFHLFRVEKFIPAELTPERYNEILNKMFMEWLEGEVNYLLYSDPETSESKKKLMLVPEVMYRETA